MQVYDYTDCDLRERDFSDRQDLLWANFSHAVVCGALFNGADLRGADFTWADLRGAYFIEADLRDTVFHGAQVALATFTRCTWRGSELDTAHQDDTTTLSDNRTITVEEEQRDALAYMQMHRPELRIIQLPAQVRKPSIESTAPANPTGLVQQLRTFVQSRILRRD